MVIGEDYHAIANHEYVWQIDESLYSEFELVTIKKRNYHQLLYSGVCILMREKKIKLNTVYGKHPLPRWCIKLCMYYVVFLNSVTFHHAGKLELYEK